MRRHPKASSARSKLRKPSGHGASLPSGRLRLAILAATVAAFLLVPVAQAAAEGLKVNLAGSGSGEVKNEFFFTPEPSIECSGPPATGSCEGAMPEGYAALAAIPGGGSVFAGWTIEAGAAMEEGGCDGSAIEKEYVEIWSTEEPHAAFFAGTEGACLIEEEGGSAELTATFNKAFPLKVEKIGEGTVTSSPGGIVCGSECEAKFEEGKTITLTASPAAGYAFSSWKGCATKPTALTCTVSMTAAKTVTATFVATPSLTVEKAGSGAGKVAATGISCDENCSVAKSAVKTATVVTVKATAAKGSEAAIFESPTGSAAVPACEGAGPCTFTISANSSVKVKFNPIPTKTLTVKLTGPGAYKGKVTGKGIVKGLLSSKVSCGSGCTTTTESFFSTDEVELSAIASTGYAFEGWTVEGGSAGTCTAKATPCKLLTDANKTVKAEFK